jgi:acetoin utilization deacetylase AcuC-like enzyme
MREAAVDCFPVKVGVLKRALAVRHTVQADRGSGKGEGFNINVPLPPGTGVGGYAW